MVKELQEKVKYLMETRYIIVNLDVAEEDEERALYDSTKGINYIQGSYQNRGLYHSYQNHLNFSYRSTNMENA